LADNLSRYEIEYAVLPSSGLAVVAFVGCVATLVVMDYLFVEKEKNNEWRARWLSLTNPGL
jgi:hypothetical protein